MFSKILKRHSRIAVDTPTHAIFLLPGRNISADTMMQNFNSLIDIQKLVFYCLEPEVEWYPMPNGIDNQSEAIEGLHDNLPIIRNSIKELIAAENIPISNTILIGFSAGGVVALGLACNFDDEYNLVISHSGAILEPGALKPCAVKTKFFLFHREDDYCFDWHERYLPMKNALISQGYNVLFTERGFGNHTIYKNDVEEIQHFISQEVF